METKIVFIHQGNSWYLPYALYQAKSSSPNSDVVLLGDDLKFDGINVEILDNLHSNEIDAFKGYYSHMSTNSEKFELFCWLRWFYLLNYMRKNNVPSVLHLDSDALLYSSIEDIKKVYAELDLKCALSIPKQDDSSFTWCASGHISYWTIEALENFCQFIINSYTEERYLNKYKEKWDWHVTQNRPGGICDMTTLYFFWQANQDLVVNWAKSYQGNVIDDNINAASNSESDEYLTKLGIKKIKFINKHPYFFSANGKGGQDRVHALHLQGFGKQHIRRLYNGKSFKGKAYSEAVHLYRSTRKKIGKLISS